jgi:sodium/proline symporter
VLLIAVIAIMVARNPDNRVLGLVSYAWAGFGAAFGPLVLFSVLWARMTRNGALAGMLVGAITVIVWKQFGWLGLYEIIPGFVFASIAIVVFSLLDKAPSRAISQRFDEAEREFQTPMQAG